MTEKVGNSISAVLGVTTGPQGFSSSSAGMGRDGMGWDGIQKWARMVPTGRVKIDVETTIRVKSYN